jgi:hypothetical protein
MLRRLLALSLAALAVPIVLPSCELYDAPPRVSVVGSVDGVVGDSSALVLELSEEVDLSTVRLKLVRLDTDLEGNLADEDADPNTTLEPIFVIDGLGPSSPAPLGATVTLEGTRLRIEPTGAFPIGPKLALLVEPGLSDLAGNGTIARERVSFSFAFTCKGNVESTVLTTGAYFFLLEVEEPIGVQIQLLVKFAVDPATGKLVGTATNADRDPAQACPTPCSGTEVCRLLPEPACVAPSERAATVDEYSDFIPNVTPPVGYSFVVQGCAEDLPDGSAGVGTLPARMVVESPPVTVEGLVLSSSFAVDDDGVLRGGGSVTAEQILLFGTPSGAGKGTFTARRIPDGEVPPGVPEPPVE